MSIPENLQSDDEPTPEELELERARLADPLALIRRIRDRFDARHNTDAERSAEMRLSNADDAVVDANSMIFISEEWLKKHPEAAAQRRENAAKLQEKYEKLQDEFEVTFGIRQELKRVVRTTLAAAEQRVLLVARIRSMRAEYDALRAQLRPLKRQIMQHPEPGTAAEQLAELQRQEKEVRARLAELEYELELRNLNPFTEEVRVPPKKGRGRNQSGVHRRRAAS